MLDEDHGDLGPGYSRLGRALAAREADQETLVEPVTLFARFWHGMTDHFRLRAISWIMSVNILAFGVTILVNPTVLSLPGRTVLYAALVQWLSPHSIGVLCAGLGGFRLGALVINGTFPTFTLSPYVRAAGSFMSGLFWFEIVLGALHSDVWTLALSVFCTFVALEAFSLYVAALEIEPRGDGRA